MKMKNFNWEFLGFCLLCVAIIVVFMLAIFGCSLKYYNDKWVDLNGIPRDTTLLSFGLMVDTEANNLGVRLPDGAWLNVDYSATQPDPCSIALLQDLINLGLLTLP